jgi:hypothetical protein
LCITGALFRAAVTRDIALFFLVMALVCAVCVDSTAVYVPSSFVPLLFHEQLFLYFLDPGSAVPMASTLTLLGLLITSRFMYHTDVSGSI